MKKISIGLVALMMFTSSFAQKGPGKPHRGGAHRMEFKGLNLSEDQQAKLKAENETFRKSMQELNKQEDITVKQQRDQRNALVKSHRDHLNNVLTPDQKSQLEKMKAERKEKMQEIAAKRMDKMKETLNLTDAQVTAIKDSREKSRKSMDAVLKNENLDREARKEQLTAIRSEMKSTMDKVLTAEQKEKMESFTKDHAPGKGGFKGGPRFRAMDRPVTK